MKATIEIAETQRDLWERISRKWRAISTESVDKKGFFAAALSGGSTPEGLYRYLSEYPGLPWDRTHIYQVDERFVPENSRESNSLMIRESLFSSISVSTAAFHRIRTDSSSARDAAIAYGDEIRAGFPETGQAVPVFDLVVLGIGADGHTASLFPGSDSLNEKKELVTDAVNDAGQERVTMTLHLINHGADIFFIATGHEKADVVARLLSEVDTLLPAALVNPVDGRLTYFLDKKAAARLDMTDK